MTERQEEKDRGPGLLLARLLVGLLQGLALFALSEARPDKPHFGLTKEFWVQIVDTLRLFFFFAPLPLLFGLGNLPARKLIPWTLVAAAAVFAFGWFASAPAWRGAPTATWLFSLIVLYILHEFVQAAHDDGRRIAAYETYFDRAWRHGFQAALAIGFTIAFTIVITLGALLFRLIGLELVFDVVDSSAFRWISSAGAFALGVHLTEADAGLTRGARQIGLALLSWLAVLMTLILSAFLLALPFTGLEPLWDTKRATVLLLNAAATMILLVNAAYQAGDPPKSAVLRTVVRFSAAPLVGVVGLAALGLWLRVNQYGFTPARVLATAELLIVTVYAIGYGAAALRPGGWLALIRPVNIAAALFVAATLTALMTPVADPARLAVADQMARLNRGAVEPDDFDFSFLSDQRSGAWGAAALKKLAARAGSPRDERIALLAKNPATAAPYGGVDQSFNDRKAALIMAGGAAAPEAALLPQGLNDPVTACVQSMKGYREEKRLEAERERQRQRLGKRLTSPVREPSDATAPVVDVDEGRCRARMLDVDFDGDDDLLILANDRWATTSLTVHALLDEGSAWRHRGVLNSGVDAVGDDDLPQTDLRAMASARRRDAFAAATATAHPFRDLVIDGRRMRVNGAARPTAARLLALIDNPDGIDPPAALLADPVRYDVAEHCGGAGACVSRRLDVDDDGAPDYVLLAVSGGGSAELLAFDDASGAITATGNVSIAAFWDRYKDLPEAERRAARAAERRRIAAGASLAPPLLGDLMIGGERASFDYVEAEIPSETGDDARR